MPSRLIELPWTEAPQEAVEVDWSNPLARGLECAALPVAFNSARGTQAYTDIVRGSLGIATANATGGIRTADATFFVVANLSAVGTDAVAMGRIRYNGSANFGCGLRFNGQTLEIDRAYGNGTWDYAANTNTLAVGRNSYAASVAASGFLASDAKLYKNGASVGTPNLTSGTTASGPVAFDGVMSVGRSSTSGQTAVGDAIGGFIEVGYYWSRVLAADEIAALHDNPWQLFQPRRIPVPVSAAGGGTTYTQNASGIFTPASALNFSAIYGRALGGITTATGSISRQTSKIFLGSYTPSATVVKQTNTTEGGSITSSGGLGASTGAEQGVAGSITVSAVTTTSVTFRRVYVATLSLAGSITKLVSKNVGGALSLAGIAFKRSTRALAGVISATGTLGSFKFTPVLGGLVTKGLRFMRKYIGRR